MKKTFLVCFALLTAFSQIYSQSVDLQIMQRIRKEGLENSKIPELLGYLTDVYAPRLAASPEYRKAGSWAVDKLNELGLQNSRMESFGVLGRGWQLKKFYAAMTEPQYMPFIAYPKAWTRGTKGLIQGDAILIDVKSADDLQKYKGKLKNAIVMTMGEQEIPLSFEPDAQRLSEDELKKLELSPEPGARSSYAGRREEFLKRRQLADTLSKFLNSEGADLVIEPARGKDGTITVQSGGSFRSNAEEALPNIALAAEQYNRMVRIIQKNIPVKIEAEIDARFDYSDSLGYNIIAELPGTDKNLKDEIIMLGGHFDSWHSGTSATDNAAGCAVAMEALRILKAIGAKPKRTIRIALWDAEEIGLIGSREYVHNNFFDSDKKQKRKDYDKFSVYFNYDNGSGKIRGIYAQNNLAAADIFKEWLKPFADLGASTVSPRNTGSTDHVAFDAVGLPGFQFIQDDLEYDTRTHHTNMDVYENASIGDLMQSAAIMAAFIYNASMMDGKFPRKFFNPDEVRPRRRF